MVRFDIVNGLKFVNNVYKMMMRVEKDEEKMGSFAPQPAPHSFELPWVEAPSGFISRGDYKGKGLVYNVNNVSFWIVMESYIANLITPLKLQVIGDYCMQIEFLYLYIIISCILTI